METGQRPKARVRRRKAPPQHDLWYLVDWYTQIRAGVPGEMNYRPLPPSEILAYRNLYDLELDAFDADSLRRLDTIWLNCRPKREG